MVTLIMSVGYGEYSIAFWDVVKAVVGMSEADHELVVRSFIWLTGSVYGSTWPDVQLLLIWLALLLPMALLFAKQLNTLGLGEDLAKGLGFVSKCNNFSW